MVRGGFSLTLRIEFSAPKLVLGNNFDELRSRDFERVLDALHRALQDMGVQWAKISNGKVRLRIYPGGVAGDEPDMVRKMRIGQLHAAALTGAGLTRISQEIQALQMPMMFRSNAEFD